MAEGESWMTRLLYSWLDVDFVVQKALIAEEWPNWLVAASAYHDGLALRVRSGTPIQAVDGILGSWFGARYQPKTGLLLEGLPDTPRVFPVQIEEASADEKLSRVLAVQPTFRRLVLFPKEPKVTDWPREFAAGSPAVVAFYSFKGGVGRTTHLLAYVLALASRAKPLRTLVIDADLEAPGLTSLLHAERAFGPAEFSFVDLLALVQSDPEAGFQTALGVATNALKKQTISVNTPASYSEHYILPAFRDPSQSLSLDIRPEHIIATPKSYWKLGEMFAALGQQLGVDAVIVDLRAGISELASPALFDPRIRRLVVTTPSRQSVDGTMLILDQLAKLAPPTDRADLYDPAIIVSFVTPELDKSDGISELDNSLLARYPESEGGADLARVRLVHTGFAQELLYVNSISDAFGKLASTNLAKVVEDVAREIVTQLEFPREIPPPVDLEEIRLKLSSLAADLEYAESGRGDRFLRIAPIRALGKQFSVTPPIAVIVGSKGAGKTYTCLQILRSKFWSKFAGIATGDAISEDWGLLWPVFQSKNLKGSAKSIVDSCKRAAAKDLGVRASLSSVAVEDAIQESLRHTKADETWWRNRWFRVIASSLGIKVAIENEAASRIISLLREKRKRLVVVLDGLEDLFPALEQKRTQQVALRALLQGIPNYLGEVPDCPLGIAVFVRADLAQAAIPQNFGQFLHLYDSFALRWNEEEALRLAVWLANEAGMKRARRPAELMAADEAREALVSVWGRKLGPDNSREARSAEWVIAALSDFRGQIQARDLVRFFRYAADNSRNVVLPDRVLGPRAIRDAIEPCSTEKIEEIKQEIPLLKGIFGRLQQSTDRRIPFDAAKSGLSVEQIHFLEAVGVLIEDRGEYFMPEIFRLGLGFQLAQGARPRVLSLARRQIG
jgi:MinD-like ATPase involved in chromosome partitioning or flagellar assembly